MGRRGLSELDGASFGPMPFQISHSQVADFVNVVGENPTRWIDLAPPSFAAAALFVVAPGLLSELGGRSVIHGDQSFQWHAPMRVGEVFEISGSVSRVRERGDTVFVTFDLEVGDSDGLVVSGSSLFLVSAEAATGGDAKERLEPGPYDSGDPTPNQRAASRLDLVRYAAATGDWNPIHWDHQSAVEAGLEGVVVHGLFQAAWVVGEASNHGPRGATVKSAKIRFRNPLMPAMPADLALETDGNTVSVVLGSDETQFLTAKLVLSDE